jgi:uncharacterized protein YkwD
MREPSRVSGTIVYASLMPESLTLRSAAESTSADRLIRSRFPRLLAAVAALGLGLFGALGAPQPASAFDEGTIHSLVNQSRAGSGLGALTLNASLSQVAANWAGQMAANGAMTHNPNYSAQIPGGWTKAAENVAQGYPSGSAVHTGWMNSPGHRANILGDFTDVGIAHISSGGTTWSVEVFAKYGASVPAPQPAPQPAAVAPPAPAPAPAPATAPAPVAAPEPSPSDSTSSSVPPEVTPAPDWSRATGNSSQPDAEPKADEQNDLATKVALGTALLAALATALGRGLRLIRR